MHGSLLTGHPRISAISFLSSGLICKGTCCRTREAPPPAATNEALLLLLRIERERKMERGMACGGEVDKKNIYAREKTLYF